MRDTRAVRHKGLIDRTSCGACLDPASAAGPGGAAVADADDQDDELLVGPFLDVGALPPRIVSEGRVNVR